MHMALRPEAGKLRRRSSYAYLAIINSNPALLTSSLTTMPQFTILSQQAQVADSTIYPLRLLRDLRTALHDNISSNKNTRRLLRHAISAYHVEFTAFEPGLISTKVLETSEYLWKDYGTYATIFPVLQQLNDLR
jgi:hypothetical protein